MAMSRITETGCWEWIAARLSKGYGHLSVAGRSRQAHRVSYEAFVGSIPEGASIGHDCLNNACVNPSHLILLTDGADPRRKLKPLPDAEYRVLLEERVTRNSKRVGECLLWRGRLTYAGYGHISVRNDNCNVHRIAYELWVGPIPDGLEIDHLCFVRHCLEPTHLEAVTHAENLRRARARAQAVK